MPWPCKERKTWHAIGFVDFVCVATTKHLARPAPGTPVPTSPSPLYLVRTCTDEQTSPMVSVPTLAIPSMTQTVPL
jgi:hypothetical protein